MPEYDNVNEPNTERKALVCNIANHPEARDFLLILNAGFIETLMPGEDTLISKGFSQEEAQSTTAAFEDYCKNHKDEIEALRIIYNIRASRSRINVEGFGNKLKLANSKLIPRYFGIPMLSSIT